MVDAPSYEIDCNLAKQNLGSGIDILISEMMQILLSFLRKIWSDNQMEAARKFVHRQTPDKQITGNTEFLYREIYFTLL